MTMAGKVATPRSLHLIRFVDNSQGEAFDFALARTIVEGSTP